MEDKGGSGGGWWRDLNANDAALIRRRHFDALGTVTPWLVGQPPTGFTPCAGAVPFPLKVPERGPEGEDLATLYTLEIDGAAALSAAAQALTAAKGAGPVTPADYPALIAHLRAEAKGVFGPKADQPH